LLPLLFASATLAAPPQPQPCVATFDESWLRARAQHLARSSQAPVAQIPEPLRKLTFDQYRKIRFRPEASVWHDAGLPFQLQPFHLGHIYVEPVALYLVEQGRACPLRVARGMFDYDGQLAEPPPEGLGVAGFRALHPLNRKDKLDEVVAFLGASYFRALGRGSVYGLSGRGLAIDTAAQGGEEFPAFRELYVERPRRGARELVVHALLDSPSVTGAYRFRIVPGDPTEIGVSATIFPRRAVGRLGLAPLTSMYLFGEKDRRGFDDYRTGVHDSDGLLIRFGNREQLWRPLQNPDRLEVSEFRAESLQGFGLLQRDRQPDHYADLEALYERRPSVWIEPTEGFGAGSVLLVEIPTREEIHDNVVAFFTPDAKLAPGVPARFSYRMLWGSAPQPRDGTSTVVATRLGSARRIGVPAAEQPVDREARKFVIDFASPAPPVNAGGAEAVVTVSSGAVKNARVQPLASAAGYRAVFDFSPGGSELVEMRCFLRRGEAALSETWSYRFQQPRGGGSP